MDQRGHIQTDTILPLGFGRHAIAGLLAGVVAATIYTIFFPLPYSRWLHVLIGAGLGAIFGLAARDHCNSVGAALVCGEAFGLAWWLVGPLTLRPLLQGESLPWTSADAGIIFTELLRQVIGFGAVLGFTYYWGRKWLPRSAATAVQARSQSKGLVTREIAPPLVQSLLVGGIGGLIGSWAFAWGIDRASFYPLVASIVGLDSTAPGRMLHYTIGTIIGVSFSLLFQRDVRKPGTGLAWGLGYGLFWWVLGPLTLMPLLLGAQESLYPDWSLAAGQRVSPSLISHLLYGALVGYLTGLGTRLWEVLFVLSDPLNRMQEGVGTRGVRGMSLGVVGGIVGGLLFTVVMLMVGALPAVARLVGANSMFAGLVVHLTISVIIGISFGLLYQKELTGYGAGLGWGMLYGLFWWVWGALALYPILLRQQPDWALSVVVAQYPSLIGHLLYGAGLGLFFYHLARRYEPKTGRRSTFAQPNGDAGKHAVTPSAALWVVTIVSGVLLPILLSIR